MKRCGCEAKTDKRRNVIGLKYCPLHASAQDLRDVLTLVSKALNSHDRVFDYTVKQALRGLIANVLEMAR